jgi:hypothetical protein
MVESQPSKLLVASSILVSRSILPASHLQSAWGRLVACGGLLTRTFK